MHSRLNFNFPLSYKFPIAAGTSRASPHSSRKKLYTNCYRPLHNCYTATPPTYTPCAKETNPHPSRAFFHPPPRLYIPKKSPRARECGRRDLSERKSPVYSSSIVSLSLSLCSLPSIIDRSRRLVFAYARPRVLRRYVRSLFLYLSLCVSFSRYWPRWKIRPRWFVRSSSPRRVPFLRVQATREKERKDAGFISASLELRAPPDFIAREGIAVACVRVYARGRQKGGWIIHAGTARRDSESRCSALNISKLRESRTPAVVWCWS